MATTMRAVLATQHGADVRSSLRFAADVAVPVPDAKKHQIRIRVAYAGCNPVDVKLVLGNMEALMKHPFPCPVGRDVSGWVDLIPDGIDNPQHLKVGDRVCTNLDAQDLSQGSMAEYTCSAISRVAKVPDSVSLRDAAALPLVALSVHAALIDTFQLQPNSGKKLLVLGGSSATGALAIQLARAYGCSAVACTSSNVPLCESLGATKVIDYRTQKWWEVLKGEDFDYIFDAVGGPKEYELSQDVLKNKGSIFYSLAGDHPDQKMTMGALIGALCGAMCRGCCSGPKYKMGFGQPADIPAALKFWFDLVVAGKVRIVVDPTSPYDFSWEGAVAMMDHQATGHAKGKLVMTVRAE